MAGKKKKPAPKPQQAKPDSAPPARPVPVVGVGASAGGLDAFTNLLRNLSPDTGFAFVLISHVGNASALDHLLQRHTGMRVHQVRRRTRIQPNRVYVISPRTVLTVDDGHLAVRPGPAKPRIPTVIDRFLISLAWQRKERAIGVILSGTGSDGMAGLAAIRAEGGIAFVQDPATASHPDLPAHAAMGDGGSGFVLSTADIARELTRIGHHPALRRPTTLDVLPGADLDALLDLIENRTGHNFREYKPATVLRRVAQRMILAGTSTVGEYLDRARRSPKEVDHLFHDLLIHFTAFFRDARTWSYLESDVVPGMLAKRAPNTPLRIWVPGCASGEEAYSLAMILEEAGASARIFATDVHEAALDKARAGVYRDTIAQTVSLGRLERFFTRTGRAYQVVERLRDMCEFTVHNVIQDPPPARIDLISCRNLLIYFGPRLQERILAGFHRALNPDGVLVLGASEAADASALFQPVDRNHRVFARADGADGVVRPARNAERGPARFRPGVVVDADGNILQFRGDVNVFLEPPPGPASLNLFRMARPSLAAELQGAFQDAKTQMHRVRRKGVRPLDLNPATFNVEVSPIAGTAEQNLFIVEVDRTDRAPMATSPGRARSARVHENGTWPENRQRQATGRSAGANSARRLRTRRSILKP